MKNGKTNEAVLLKVDGSRTVVIPENGTNFTLDELYALIGCDMIGAARSQATGKIGQARRNYILIIDEEGKCKADWQINRSASEWQSSFEDCIAGSALLCHTSMVK